MIFFLRYAIVIYFVSNYRSATNTNKWIISGAARRQYPSSISQMKIWLFCGVGRGLFFGSVGAAHGRTDLLFFLVCQSLAPLGTGCHWPG